MEICQCFIDFRKVTLRWRACQFGSIRRNKHLYRIYNIHECTLLHIYSEYTFWQISSCSTLLSVRMLWQIHDIHHSDRKLCVHHVFIENRTTASVASQVKQQMIYVLAPEHTIMRLVCVFMLLFKVEHSLEIYIKI